MDDGTDGGGAGRAAIGFQCGRQAIMWNAKKVSKRLGGERYLQLRRLLLGHSAEVRWGDQP